jgi:hypothetical protein
VHACGTPRGTTRGQTCPLVQYYYSFSSPPPHPILLAVLTSMIMKKLLPWKPVSITLTTCSHLPGSLLSTCTNKAWTRPQAAASTKALQHVLGRSKGYAGHAVAAGGITSADEPAFKTSFLPTADVNIPRMLCAGTGCLCAPATCCCSSTRALQKLLLLLEKSNTGSKGYEHSTCAARSSPLVPNLGFMQH